MSVASYEVSLGPMVILHSDAAAGASAVLTPQQQSVLAERIRCGETSAEEELDRLFRRRVLFLALARTRDPEGARDVTQDVMLAVVLALRDGHLREAERLAAFVYGTARNVISNYLRTRSRLPKEDPIGDELHLPSMPDPIEHTERADLVQRALGALDSNDRKILLLTLVEGLKPGEIAVRLGLTAEVVRTRKSRALKKTIERVKKLSRT
jgi:RNA polymerase sigma factor (sigma-70 family)